MERIDEKELIEKAKHEPEAFGDLYRHYVERIYNYHYRHTNSREEAEDLTSRTFYRALRNLHAYQDRGATFQAWLFRIAHNLLVNHYRDSGRRPSIALEDAPPLSAEYGNPERELESEETQSQLLDLIATLPEERKTLVILKFVEQMSNTEIGIVLGKSEGAVKALYHRTLTSLRAILLMEQSNHDFQNP